MTKKDYYSILAIQSLLKGSLISHLISHNLNPTDVNNKKIDKLLHDMSLSGLILDGFPEDINLYNSGFLIELGNLIYKSVFRIKLSVSLETYIFYVGIREKDKYFFCDVYVYNPYSSPFHYKLPYFEEMV